MAHTPWVEVLTRVEQNFSSCGTLFQEADQSLMSLAIESTHTQAAVRGLDEEAYSVETSAAIYTDDKAIRLAAQNGWSAYVTRQRAQSDFAQTYPMPSALALLAPDVAADMIDYPLEGNLNDYASKKSWQLGQATKHMMRYGVFYALTGTKNAKHLDIKGQSALVVSISGPSFYPISFNFDLRNGQYSYSSFSDQITTSHGFYALLVQMAVSDPRVLACFSQAERQALGEDLSNRIRFGLVDDETAWRLLQALGKVSKDKALSVMATLTNHPNSDIAQKSRAILQKNKG